MLPTNLQINESTMEAEHFYILLDQETNLPHLEMMEDPADGQTKPCLIIFANLDLTPRIIESNHNRCPCAVGELHPHSISAFLKKVQENNHVALIAVEKEGEVRLQQVTHMYSAPNV